MKECEKQIEKLPIRESWEGYHLTEIYAEEKGFRNGWRKALECALEKCHHYQSQDVINFILEELKQ